MNHLERRVFLKSLLDKEKSIPVPGASDALSAKLIESVGFPVVYTGSYAASANSYGFPDIGLLGLDEMVKNAEKVVNAVSIPVIADAEDGFNNAANIWRTIEMFENIGASGVHIEDNKFGKHTNVQQELVPMEEMIAKIKAAIDSRKDNNFLIIARTDAYWSLNDLEDGIKRVNAYSEAGADLVFLTGIAPDILKEVRSRITGKVVTVDSPGFSVYEEEQANANIVLYYAISTYAAFQGIKNALVEFKEHKDLSFASKYLADVDEFEDFMGYKEFVKRAKKYDLV